MPERSPRWFEDDGFWSDTYLVNFAPARFLAAEGEIDRLIGRIGVVPRRCLDLACGPGRHAVALARRGIAVTGVDKSAFLLAKAAALVGEAGLTVDFVRADVRDHVAPGRYDLIVHLFNSFGYFSPTDNFAVLRNCFESLAPGGWLVIEAVGRVEVAEDRTWIDPGEDGIVVTRRRSPSKHEEGLIHYAITVDRADGSASHRYDVMSYTADKLRTLLCDAGFVDVAAAGDFDGRPYVIGTSRLIMFARKPGSPGASVVR